MSKCDQYCVLKCDIIIKCDIYYVIRIMCTDQIRLYWFSQVLL